MISAQTVKPVGTVNVTAAALVAVATAFISKVGVAQRNSSPFCENALMFALPLVRNEPMRRNLVSVIPAGSLAQVGEVSNQMSGVPALFARQTWYQVLSAMVSPLPMPFAPEPEAQAPPVDLVNAPSAIIAALVLSAAWPAAMSR